MEASSQVGRILYLRLAELNVASMDLLHGLVAARNALEQLGEAGFVQRWQAELDDDGLLLSWREGPLVEIRMAVPFWMCTPELGAVSAVMES